MASTLNYKIIGETAQLLEIDLEPDGIIIADAGALLYIDEEIEWETRPTDGADEIKDSSLEDELLSEEEPLPEDEVLDEPEPDFTDKFPEDEPEKDEPLIQKLFSVGKKFIQNIGDKMNKPEDDTEMEEELSSQPSFENDLMPPSEDQVSEEPTENWFITHFSNHSEYIRKIAFTTSNSGVVLPIDLDEMLDNEVIVQTGRFLCARKGVHIEKHLDTDISVSFVQEKFYNLDILQGTGTVFLQGEGHVIEKSLDNDAISISLFSLIAFESSLEIDLNSLKKMSAMWHEESNLIIQLVGSGRFWLQTANVQHLVYRISPFIFEPPSAADASDINKKGAFEFTPEPEPSSDFMFENKGDDIPEPTSFEDALKPIPESLEDDDKQEDDEESKAE